MDYKTSKVNKKRAVLTIVFCVLLSIIITLLIFAIRGRTSETKTEIRQDVSEAVMCTSSTAAYPILDNNKQLALEIKVNIALLESKISSIGLTYTATYPDKSSIDYAFNILQSDMNSAIFDAGLEFGALNNKWSKYDNRLILSIFAEEDEINEKTKQFFLLYVDIDDPTNAKDLIVKSYKRQGFTCRTN